MPAAVIHLNEDKPSSNTDSFREKVDLDEPVVASAFDHLSGMETLRTFWKASLMCVLAAFAACSDGYQYSLPGNLIANQGFINQFATITVAGKPAIDPQHLAVWGGVYSAGYIVSLLVAGYPSDMFGRRFAMALLTVYLVIGAACEVTATEWIRWLIGKLMAGLATGLVQASVATYVSEVAPTKIRGALLGVYSVYFALGQLAAAGALQGIELSAHPLEYRHALYSAFAFSGVVFLILLIIPESPRYYCRKGLHDKGKASLRRLNGGVKGYDIEAEYAVLEKEVEEGKTLAKTAAGVSYISMFRGTNLRRTWISFAPLAWQQLIGIPVVFGYTSYFFQQAGLKNPFNGTIAVYVILLAGIVASFYFVEKVGRRRLLIFGGIIMCGSLVIIGALACVTPNSATPNVIVSFMCLWVAAYALSAGPLGYVYLGESSTPILRAKTTGFAAAGTGGFGLIFNYCTPLMLSAKPAGAGWGVKTAFLFAGFGFLGLVLIYFTVPETKGRSYIELDELFARGVSSRHFASTQTSVDLARTDVKTRDEV